MSPDISVIIACYNKEAYILQSIDAVLQQQFKNFEVIVVDDNSTDRSVELIRAVMAKDDRIRLVTNTENKGANFCRNAGIHAATSGYLLFYDADDVLAKNCLHNRINFVREHPSLDFAVFTMQVFREYPGDTNFNWNPSVKQPLVNFLSHDLPWQTMQPLWKKQFIEKLGGFDETFKRLQDVELHTRALLVAGVKFLTISGPPDCFYRIDESRKNFNAFNFYKRWTEATLMYCDKFNTILPRSLKRYLPGTIFKTYLQLLNAYKVKDLKKEEFLILENGVYAHAMVSGVKKLLFKFSRFYNLHFIRVPGINKFTHIFIMLGV